MTYYPPHRRKHHVETPSGIIRDGLVARWIFDEGSGNVMNDDSGNGHTGTGVNNGWAVDVAGRPGTCVYIYEYQDAYITVPHAPEFNLTVFTYVGWARNIKNYPNYYELVSKGVDGNGWGLYFHFANLRFWHTGYTDVAQVSWPKDDRNWGHICATCDGTTRRIYKDNVEGSSDSDPINPVTDTDVFKFGFYTGQDPEFRGQLQDHRLYNRVIDATERAAIFAGTG